jgi:IS605 OrfB family transposase
VKVYSLQSCVFTQIESKKLNCGNGLELVVGSGIIATLHKKIANQRKDFHHKLSTTLITKAQVIGMESLNVKGMSRGRLAKSVHDAGWGFFTRMLEYKANWYGREIVKLGRFERSTGCCSQGGVIGPKLKLGIDTWTCDCGVTHDRDLEANNWIKTVVKEKVSRGTAEPAITHGESKPLPDKLSSGKPTRGTVKTKCYA